MKTLRAGGTYAPFDKQYDRKKLKQIDIDQNRRRLNAVEVEGMIYLAVADMMVGSAAEMLKAQTKHAGQQRRMNMLPSMLHNAVQGLSNQIQSEQLITIANNCNGAEISLTTYVKPGSMNIQYQHMQDIVNHALQSCELLCDKTREQSKACPVRRALENVPGMRGAARERAQYCGDSCPYAGLTMEMEEGHDPQD